MALQEQATEVAPESSDRADWKLPIEPRRFRRLLTAIAVLGLIVVTALASAWMYLHFVRHDTTGLEGTWRWASETSRTTYEFLPSGALASWNGPKDWWTRI